MGFLELVEFVPAFLNYAIIGLGFLFVLLAYWLLRSEAKKPERSPAMERAIKTFMALSVALATGGGFIEAEKVVRTPEGFGQVLGQAARRAFLSGAPDLEVDGRWEVQWLNEQGEPYKIQDPETGELVAYPNDRIQVQTKDAQISCASYDQTTRLTYWLEGRISTEDIVTLIYWSKEERAESALTGVVFLELIKEVGKPLKMKGWWRGYTRDGKTTFGDVEWTKLG